MNKHVIIGTAGHIDHGKTALIRALTGRETDRLKEEKERGITIELGFASFDLPGGLKAGVIDVPGHEKFIGNMVSGVVGMDLVLAVIAADEGIMPQTREHLDILETLGVQKSILVLNKCDLVDADWLTMVEEEIRTGLRDTFMEEAPLVRVSAKTGEGIDALKEEIVRLITDEVKPRDTGGIPRLPIDRVFTLTGFGTIVTGTLLSGKINKEDVLQLYPKEDKVRIRSIQVYGQDTDEAYAGQRVALNLTGVGRDMIRRGNVLAPPGNMRTADRIDVRIQILKDAERILTNRERLHFYSGTSEILCRALLLDKEEIGPGEEGWAQLILEEKIALRRGDRFVIRFYSPMETIGGGIVLEPAAKKEKRFREDTIRSLSLKASGTLADVCELHIKEHPEELITLSELGKRTGHQVSELTSALEELTEAKTVLSFGAKKDIWYWHMEDAYAVFQDITKDLTRFHAKYPYRHGVRKAEVHAAYMKKIRQNIFDLIIAYMEREGIVEADGEYLRIPGFSVARDETFLRIRERFVSQLTDAGYDVARVTELSFPGEDEKIVADVMQILLEEEVIVRLDEEFMSTKELMDQAVTKILDHLSREKTISVIQTRELFATNRKSANAIIHYTDAAHVTKQAPAATEREAYR